jgi:hypothetical protein
MKKYFLLLALIVLASAASASVKIEEELYIIGQRPEIVRDLIQAGSVEIDHVTSQGFELYGRKGLSQYLEQRNIPFFDMKSVTKSLLSNYPSHEQITARLMAAQSKRPELIKVFSIGKSVKGRELLFVKISDNVNTDEVEPEFKYISSMHGDEITGRELTTQLIEEIAEKYGKDAEITELVNNTEIFIMPSMNPDGSALKQRANANGTDLNRNFPHISHPSGNTSSGMQIENQAIMKFQSSRQFALSANFHGGTIVANYPWDSTYERHPLDQLVQELATIYSEHNPDMRNSSEFRGGITNGADWYVVKGGMQDWSYFWYNDLQITVELSHSKWPSYSDIPTFYRNNRDSMIAFMKQVHRGAGFKLRNASGVGSVTIKQVAPAVKSLGSFAYKGAEFYKVLPVGQYQFSVADKSGKTKTVDVLVEKDKISANGNYVVVD